MGKRRRTMLWIINLSVVMILSLITFSAFGNNKGYTDYLLMKLEGPIDYNDPELLQYIRNKILVKPSTEPYNLLPRQYGAYGRLQSEIFYREFITKVFNSTYNGFFVEAGAFEGDILSNTIWLEKYRGWTGLLVEPDPSSFNELLPKNRKVWSANACLSIEKYPKKELLSSLAVVKDETDKALRSMGSILRVPGKTKGITSEDHFNSYYSSQCFPLGSFLLALNVTKIDLLSLDVEFVEEFILRNFDFDQFDIQVIFLEFYAHDRKIKLHDFLASKGFEFIANQEADLIYCKSGTEIAKRIGLLYPTRDFTLYRPN